MPFYDENQQKTTYFGSKIDSGPKKYGNIFILFKVKFPDSIDLEQVAMLKQTLSNLDGMVSPPV